MKYIITESQDNKFKKLFRFLVDKKGFLLASKNIGGLSKLLDVLGKEFLTLERKIELIKEIILSSDFGYISVEEDLNIEPIKVFEKNGEIGLIERLYPQVIPVSHYGGYDYSEDRGRSFSSYETISDDLFDYIFELVVNYYDDRH
jgi:hypothetical protein